MENEIATAGHPLLPVTGGGVGGSGAECWLLLSGRVSWAASRSMRTSEAAKALLMKRQSALHVLV